MKYKLTRMPRSVVFYRADLKGPEAWVRECLPTAERVEAIMKCILSDDPEKEGRLYT